MYNKQETIKANKLDQKQIALFALLDQTMLNLEQQTQFKKQIKN